MQEHEHKLKLWAQISSEGGWVFHMKGWGPKSSVCPSKPRENKIGDRISRDVGSDVPGVPRVLRKILVYKLWPLERVQAPKLIHFEVC